MYSAFGKPQGTVARVHIGQVIISIHTKLQNKEHVTEAQLRAKFMFPGHQEIHISKNWGFTKFNADEYENMAAEKRLIPDGCGVKYIPSCGLLDKRLSLMRALALSPPYSCPPINPTFLSKKKIITLLSQISKRLMEEGG
ncbi:hypothetical protein E2I00_003155 [Balaenoptera physalus]|uniref:Ribosomal protein L10e/L16 domain-containing protein n=1 Tax=Balaenoptera physalus TaxID=9770 RepID=A0A643CFF6_BALPH|nr:hypothetical protein E2I00_003155 [Balaenoptera physalus]